MSRILQFFERLHSYAALPCMQEPDSAVPHTYSELVEAAQVWRVRFGEFNLGPDATVGLRSDYSLTAVGALLGLLLSRAHVALIPRDNNIEQYLADACVTDLLEVDLDSKYRRRSLDPRPRHPLLSRVNAEADSGIVLFTSGSTGRPKAALHSVERILHKFDKPGRRLRTLAFLRFDHVAGIDTLFYTLANGGTLVLTHRRDPHSILELMAKHQVEVLPSSPSFLRLLCASGERERLSLPQLRVITYGSEPMDASTLARLNTLFPDTQISQKYGTTETGAPRTISRGNDSLWLKIVGAETKVVDAVLWIRSVSSILGYLNAPAPFDAEGWYCTGDLVDVDGEWIRFRGRTAELINVGGEKVAPTEVEQAILELDFVRDVLVAGCPHSLLGQIVTAQVVLSRDDIQPPEAAKRIRTHCRARLAPYKVPIEIRFVSGGFVNDRQKIQRRAASDDT